MSRRAAIVVTTIFEPAFLPGYLDNLRLHGRRENSSIIIIPDRKTPASVFQAAETARGEGFDVRCPGFDEQEDFVSRLGLPDGLIPWNSDNRRNAGYLMAIEEGFDVLVSIDDDNYCPPETDFLGAHEAVGGPCEDRQVSSSDGWFNVCNLLESDVKMELFARGFPYSARRNRRNISSVLPNPVPTVAVNSGLWTADPDVDAVSRLSLGPQILSFKGQSVVLAKGTWSPVNTQNTALTREAAGAYYYVLMGHPVRGGRIDRYGDILSGYFVQKCAQHLGQAVRFGTPVAEHRRTPHDLLNDLHHELPGIMLLEELLPWLLEQRLEGSDYPEAYASLAALLADAAPGFKGAIWDEGGRDFIAATAGAMRAWLEAVRMLSA